MFCRKIIFKILIILICVAGLVQAKESIEFGNEAFKKGDYEKAIEYYKLAIKNEPSFSEYVNLGHCYMQLEKWEEACLVYEGAISLNQEAAEPPLYRLLGRAYFESKKYEQAKEAFQKAFSLEPENHENGIWMARCAIELEQWIESQSILFSILNHDMNNTIALELLAYVYNQQGYFSNTIFVYRELIKIKPANISYRVTLAKLLVNQGDNKQAIDILELAGRLDSKYDLEISKLLGDLYLSENMSREAVQYYENIIVKKEIPSADDYYRLGIAYFTLREFVSSGDIFKLMRIEYQDDFRADMYLGRICIETERFEDAMECYISAVKKNPEFLESLIALSDLQIKNKLYSDASKNLAQAIEQGGNGFLIYYKYIFSLIKDNNSIGAKKAIKKALALYPSEEKIRFLLNKYIAETFTE